MKITIYEALNTVNIAEFVKKYNIKIKGIYHKKRGYNTSGHPYNFSAKEQEELKAAFILLGEELQNINFLIE